MKKLLAIAVAALVACAIFLFLQNQAQEKLRAEDEELRQQIAQLKADNENLSNAATQAKSSQSLPDEQFTELLKLRGEVGVLRQQVDGLRQQTNELGKLQEENQRLGSALKQAGSFSASKPATPPMSLDLFLQQKYQEDEEQIQTALINLDLLRKEYNITDNSPDSIDENGDAAATLAEKPYWDEKRKIIPMLKFHLLLQVKIAAEKLDQEIPKN
jgi:myosin heavy subunit